MEITQWLKSLIHTEQKTMPEIKDIVTDELVKNALKSEEVIRAVKRRLRTHWSLRLRRPLIMHCQIFWVS